MPPNPIKLHLIRPSRSGCQRYPSSTLAVLPRRTGAPGRGAGGVYARHV